MCEFQKLPTFNAQGKLSPLPIVQKVGWSQNNSGYSALETCTSVHVGRWASPLLLWSVTSQSISSAISCNPWNNMCIFCQFTGVICHHPLKLVNTLFEAAVPRTQYPCTPTVKKEVSGYSADDWTCIPGSAKIRCSLWHSCPDYLSDTPSLLCSEYSRNFYHWDMIPMFHLHLLSRLRM